MNRWYALIALCGLIATLDGCACGACEQDNGDCPEGTSLKGAAPPDGTEQWCEKDGIKEGPYTSWHDDGKKSEHGQYVKGMKDGRWTAWYDTGQVEWEAEYKQDEKHGAWSRFYRNGVQASDGRYVDGKMEGRWISWFNNGKKSEEGQMKGGKNHGKWKYYNKLGRLKRTERYDRGAKKSSKLVTAGGDSEDLLVDTQEGRKDPRCPEGAMLFGAPPPSGTKEWCQKDKAKEGGYWEYWDEGQRLIEGKFAGGKKTGVWTEFYKNGNKTSEGKFEHGRETGKWTYWYINGQKRTAGEYVKGKKVGAWKEWTDNGLESTQNYK